ncbi:MAG TPA: hypothetical protein PLB14_02755 [Smithellaceae bacterium]|jgi:hypothetical protein|nr:hypothetical protein [Syntrophaceae bacterium]HPV48599.1 hypothetical protein [Smithellaceae bacterium]
MKMKEESAFLQGVESRLDSLFAEDDHEQKVKTSEPVPAENVKPPPAEDAQTSEVSDESESTGPENNIEQMEEVPQDNTPPQGASKFMTEIEQRFAAIFGPDDKEAAAPMQADEQNDLKNIMVEAAQGFGDTDEQNIQEEEFSAPSSVVYNSPLKDMKSIILSIEWEINEGILEQLEEEINKLYLFYTGDRIIQGFLRILRFLGRYIRVRGTRTNQDSANLLLSVYDQFESVMIQGGMNESRKQAVLVDSIRKYRAWAVSANLEAGGEIVPEEPVAEESLVPAPIEEEKEEIPVVDDAGETKIPTESEEFDLPAVETAAEEESEAKPEEQPVVEFAAQAFEAVDTAPEVPAPRVFGEEAVMTEEVQLPSPEKDFEDKVAAIKELSPHEAVVYAVEEMKKTFQAEIDALREEIRFLKGGR